MSNFQLALAKNKRKCKVCKESYKPKAHNQLTCSKKCAGVRIQKNRKARWGRVRTDTQWQKEFDIQSAKLIKLGFKLNSEGNPIVDCSVCGEEYVASRRGLSQLGSRRDGWAKRRGKGEKAKVVKVRNYCSDECRKKVVKIKNAKRYCNGGSYKKNCCICNVEFETRSTKIITCSSPACKKERDARCSMGKKTKLIKTCPTCEKEFETKLWLREGPKTEAAKRRHIRSTRQDKPRKYSYEEKNMYCSRECYLEFYENSDGYIIGKILYEAKRRHLGHQKDLKKEDISQSMIEARRISQLVHRGLRLDYHLDDTEEVKKMERLVKKVLT